MSSIHSRNRVVLGRLHGAKYEARRIRHQLLAPWPVEKGSSAGTSPAKGLTLMIMDAW